MPKDEKYIVFRRYEVPVGEELAAMERKYGQPINAGQHQYDEGTELQDAVVIRTKDVFAAPALYGYAHGISLAAKLFRAGGDEAHAKQLQDIADYFADRAHEATESSGKLPD